jgi:hypothetical protein
MSQVINVKKAELKKLGYSDLLNWLNSSTNHVYIGRDMTHYVPGAVGSKWANPFKVDKYGREDCLRRYEEHVRATAELMAGLGELDNRVLGCWCRPEGCHGDVLIKLVAETKAKN